MSELRVALIGYGLAGRWFHAPLIAANPDLRLTSVVTSNSERGRQAEEDHPGVRVVADAAQLWEEPLPELAVVATTNASHVPLATAAVERGVPVVVDKPLGVSSDEAQKLVRAAEAAGVLLTVFQNRRWDSDYLTLRRLVEAGRLGEVLRVESRFERWRPDVDASAWRTADPVQGGGQLLDLGSHLVDQVVQLLGPVTHIYAEISSLRGLPADDDAFLALHHAAGAISHLRASALTAAPGPRLRVLGREAAFVVQEPDSQEQLLRAGHRPDGGADWGQEPASAWGRLLAGEAQEVVPSERGDWPAFYRQLARALRDGGPAPVDPWDAVETLRILDLARQSATTGSVLALTA
ncbi:MAG TPA: Gfo/Idh/MocA family oxidoreductase [Solirubrobacteraceae bacterium]|nr:Gfo/Idh/MocA family oxidoreductase [Solirubrobacteraceae bacterium]